jgi:hypothetical protein
LLPVKTGLKHEETAIKGRIFPVMRIVDPGSRAHCLSRFGLPPLATTRDLRSALYVGVAF